MALLQRRVASTVGRMLLEGPGAVMGQGFPCSAHVQRPLLPLPAVAAASASPGCCQGGLRWHSELVDQKRGSPQEFVYEGPFANAVLRVKRLSLFSCLCAVGAGPVILGLDAATTATAKASIVATLASFGVFTTGLLTWFTQPYITRLRYTPSTDTLEATTLSLWAQPRTDRFHVAEVAEAASVHPLTTFQARGRRYYIDADHFADKALLARLQPAATAAHVVEAAEAAAQRQQQQEQQEQRSQQGENAQ